MLKILKDIKTKKMTKFSWDWAEPSEAMSVTSDNAERPTCLNNYLMK